MSSVFTLRSGLERSSGELFKFNFTVFTQCNQNACFIHDFFLCSDGENEYRSHGGGPAASISAAD